MDYRPLNEVTIKDPFLMPLIKDLINALSEAQYFVQMDIRSGYWQIPMEETSAQFTAFRCHKGVYEFKIMPFGLSNAPATFQRLMDHLFGDMYYHGVLIYLDDICLYARTFEELKPITEEVFRRLDEINLTIHLGKSHFGYRKIQFLGQVIEGGVMTPDPKY